MKKWFFLCALSAFLFTSCKKTTDPTTCSELAPTTIASAAETAYLQTYLTSNGITATEKNGMFYAITTQGTGTSPNICSTITVDYVGNYINGTSTGSQFDASQPGLPYSSSLNYLIAGWKLILPLVKSGGTVNLYIPPSLAYGSTGQAPIPGNAYLKFLITLRAVQ
jgi:FKBP-type peptidyl-prolyl cis-trans isomerase